MTPPFAHLGHWYVSLVYVAPVAVIALGIAYQNWRDRRRRAVDDHESQTTRDRD